MQEIVTDVRARPSMLGTARCPPRPHRLLSTTHGSQVAISEVCRDYAGRGACAMRTRSLYRHSDGWHHRDRHMPPTLVVNRANVLLSPVKTSGVLVDTARSRPGSRTCPARAAICASYARNPRSAIGLLHCLGLPPVVEWMREQMRAKTIQANGDSKHE